MRARLLPLVGLLAALTACGATAPGSPDATDQVDATGAPTAAATKLSSSEAKRVARTVAPARKEFSGYRDATLPPLELDDPTIKDANKCLQVKPAYLARADRSVFVKGKHSLLVQADVYTSAAEAEKFIDALRSRGSHCLQETARVDRSLTTVDYDSEKVSVAGSTDALAWWADSTNKVGKVGRKVVIHTTTYVIQARVGQTVILVSSNRYGSSKVSRSQAVHTAEKAVARVLAAGK